VACCVPPRMDLGAVCQIAVSISLRKDNIDVLEPAASSDAFANFSFSDPSLPWYGQKVLKLQNRSLARALAIVGVLYSTCLPIPFYRDGRISFVPWPLDDARPSHFAFGNQRASNLTSY
jgi:hypothetical protein